MYISCYDIESLYNVPTDRIYLISSPNVCQIVIYCYGWLFGQIQKYHRNLSNIMEIQMPRRKQTIEIVCELKLAVVSIYVLR